MKFQEAQIIALSIEAKAIEAEIIAMQAADALGDARYTEDMYLNKAQELYAIANQIQEIARSGYLD
ncbi:MAG: hypothetical protein ACYC0Z_12995 [Acidobacteriaceae bacterium]